MPSTPVILLALAGLAFCAAGWCIRLAAVESGSWLPVSATVLSSDIQPQEGSFTPVVSYRYAIGGQTHVSSDLGLFLVSCSEASARAAASRYPVGSPVIAYVNPKNHRQAILEPRPNSPFPIVFLAAGLLLIGISIYLFVMGVPTPR